jgi:hypothetical protein
MSEDFKIDENLARSLWQVPVPIDLIRDTSISPNSLRLYLDLLSYARDRVTCYPSAKQLAHDIGLSERYVHTLSNELREHGLLTWTTARGSDGRDHNTYTLLEYKPIKKSRVNPSSRVGCSPEYSNNTQLNHTNELDREYESHPQKSDATPSQNSQGASPSKPLDETKTLATSPASSDGYTEAAPNPPAPPFRAPPSPARPTLEEAIAYAGKLGFHESWAQSWYENTAGNGWKVNGAEIQDWKGAEKCWIETAVKNQKAAHTPPTSPKEVIDFLQSQGVDGAEDKGLAFFVDGERHEWANLVTGKLWKNWRALALSMDNNGDQLNRIVI